MRLVLRGDRRGRGGEPRGRDVAHDPDRRQLLELCGPEQGGLFRAGRALLPRRRRDHGARRLRPVAAHDRAPARDLACPCRRRGRAGARPLLRRRHQDPDHQRQPALRLRAAYRAGLRHCRHRRSARLEPLSRHAAQHRRDDHLPSRRAPRGGQGRQRRRTRPQSRSGLCRGRGSPSPFSRGSARW